ncbi:cytochrome b561 [Rhizobiales bacterium GAS191]|nr:cytochrome b561 [Rhizobiales bacterium GAS191]
MRQSYTLIQRSVHWLMAVAILAMLFIGIGMVSTVAPRYWSLISTHKLLGIAILLLAFTRLGLRARYGAPVLAADLPPPMIAGARASHVLLYVLMIAMPLIGWSMLSAGGYPIVVYGPIHLPPIAPHNDTLYTILRFAHTWGALLFFAAILMHIAAALFHALVRRDDVFSGMAPWKSRRRSANTYSRIAE